jgi:D-tyrosyl-tRNA(Tyr) deacylase
VDGQIVGQIGRGLLVYMSVGRGDSEADAEFMAEKLVNLRIFADEAGPSTGSTLSTTLKTGALTTGSLRTGKMNRSIQDVGGEILLVSNFTLHGDCRKGRRPGFDAACEPAIAEGLYEKTAQLIADRGVKVAKGVFGAYMEVASVNDGPVTFLLDSSRLF